MAPVALNAQEKNEGQPSKNAVTYKVASNHVRPPVYVHDDPPHYKRKSPCESAQYGNNSDLCQQWRMAESAESQATWTQSQVWATVAEVVGLILIIGFTAWTGRAAMRSAKAAAETVGAMRRSERAYVTMSHKQPGLDVLTHPGYATFSIEIKNKGRTPATVTDVLIQLDWFGEGNPAPDKPPYRTNAPRQEVGFFLVTDGYFYHITTDKPIPGDGDGNELWLYGYADYTDEFGDRHRSGYARVYRAAEKNNNLVFVDKAGWNYDSPRPASGDD